MKKTRIASRLFSYLKNLSSESFSRYYKQNCKNIYNSEYSVKNITRLSKYINYLGKYENSRKIVEEVSIRAISISRSFWIVFLTHKSINFRLRSTIRLIAPYPSSRRKAFGGVK